MKTPLANASSAYRLYPSELVNKWAFVYNAATNNEIVFRCYPPENVRGPCMYVVCMCVSLTV